MIEFTPNVSHNAGEGVACFSPEFLLREIHFE